jgi:hypothetical protein
VQPEAGEYYKECKMEVLETMKVVKLDVIDQKGIDLKSRN